MTIYYLDNELQRIATGTGDPASLPQEVVIAIRACIQWMDLSSNATDVNSLAIAEGVMQLPLGYRLGYRIEDGMVMVLGVQVPVRSK
jgi:hypothetical protein